MISYTKGSRKQVLAKIQGNWGICGGLVVVVQFVVALLETGSNFQRPTCLCQARTLMLSDSDTVCGLGVMENSPARSQNKKAFHAAWQF